MSSKSSSDSEESSEKQKWDPKQPKAILRKLFIGGIDYTTTDESLREYFSQFGDVIDSVVMKDQANKPRGFGFVTFGSMGGIDAAQKARPHKLDGRLVETKRAVPRSEGRNSSSKSANNGDTTHNRIFVGGLNQDLKEEDLEMYFTMFGQVTCVNIMFDKGTSRHRGFAFVDFNDYDPVDKITLIQSHSIKGFPIDVKKAISKWDMSKRKATLEMINKTPTQNNTSNTGMHSRGQPLTQSFHPTHPAQGFPLHMSPQTFSNQNQTHLMANQSNPMRPALFMQQNQANVPQGFAHHGWEYSIWNNAEVLRNKNTNAGATPSQSTNKDNSSDSSSDSSGDMMIDDLEMNSSAPWFPAMCGDQCPAEATVLVIEPFYGGSHKQLIDTLRSENELLSDESTAIFSLPSKKWHWRARTSALYFAQNIPLTHKFKVLFASSTLNLTELIGLRPDLASLRKILYFHENQLVYPIQTKKERDFQYGYNQIISCLTADVVVFNSQYNLDTFLRETPRHLKIQPDYRPDAKNIVELVKNKSQVIYFPINIAHKVRAPREDSDWLHIVWPHRWEHDKDPDTFFQVMLELKEKDVNFKLSVIGQSYNEIPKIFTTVKKQLGRHIANWGYMESKEKYWEVLHSADVVVSTAQHEFFGVAMLEAVGAGCYPLCPNRLVYPEIFPQECLYNTSKQLKKALVAMCQRPRAVRAKKVDLDLSTYHWSNLKFKYEKLFNPT